MALVNIQQAIDLLLANNVVAIPTETVYGLAGNIYNDAAITAIFEHKQRPLYNPLIVHISNINELPKIASHIPASAMQLAQAFWPGPLTLVLPKQNTISHLVTGGKDTVGVRIPNHALSLELLSKLPFPVAAPSANPFNYLSPTTAQAVSKGLPHVAVLDGGACTVGIESTVIGFPNDLPTLYRYGSISKELIEAVLGHTLQTVINNNTTPAAPGMLDKHYSPNTKLIISPDVMASIAVANNKKIGVLTFKNKYEHANIKHQITLSDKGSLEQAATNFFAALHLFDTLDLDLIITEIFPNEGIGIAINDRLMRAAK
jgi:L-threonylcarbamoyladenylate synthase